MPQTKRLKWRKCHSNDWRARFGDLHFSIRWWGPAFYVPYACGPILCEDGGSQNLADYGRGDLPAYTTPIEAKDSCERFLARAIRVAKSVMEAEENVKR